MNRSLLLLLVLSLLIASACAAEVNLLDETKLKDTSLLSREPCAPPCWNGIVPGETSYRDAKIIIEDAEGLQNIQESEAEEGQTIRALGFSEGDAAMCCQVSAQDGETIDTILLQLAPQMTLGPVLNAYGEPSYLIGGEQSAEQAYMALLWEEVPMVVFVFIAGAAEGRLGDGSEVINVMYMAAPEMQAVLDCSQFYAWEGYGSYADYIDEEYDYKGQFIGQEQCQQEGQ